MKVARNTPSHLIVTDTPWLIGILFSLNVLIFVALGLVLTLISGKAFWYGLAMILTGVAFGLFTFGLQIRRVQVVFDRPNGSVEIRQKSIFGYDAIQHTLSELSHAEVESTLPKSTFWTQNQHRPVLVLHQGMSAGQHPIIRRYTKGSDSQRLVDAINEWLSADTVDSGSQSA